MRRRKTESCPQCGAQMIPIVYGFPTGATFEKAERGEVHIGGCVIMPDNPQFHCKNCANGEDDDA
ncbi:MAG: hypothetical protein ACRDV9_09415 [Acidimicrobiia bacterium]